MGKGLPKSWLQAANGGIGQNQDEFVALNFIEPTIVNNKKNPVFLNEQLFDQ